MIRTHRPAFAGHSERWRKEQQLDAQRARDPAIASLYHSPAWLELRRVVIIEAQGRCATNGCTRRASIVDHRVPHRGDRYVFFDRTNLQALCKVCHDRKTARQDGGFGNARR